MTQGRQGRGILPQRKETGRDMAITGVRAAKLKAQNGTEDNGEEEHGENVVDSRDDAAETVMLGPGCE